MNIATSSSTLLLSSPTKFVVKVTDIRGDQLPNFGWPKRPGKFYARLSIDQKTRETAVSKRSNAPTWTETFYFDARGSSTFKLQIYAKHRLGSDGCIGGMEENIESLLSQGNAVTRVLSKPDSNGTAGELRCDIGFTIESMSAVAGASEHQMDEAVKAVEIEHMKLVPGAASTIDHLDFAINQGISISHNWEPLLKKVEQFTKIVDRIAEVHPYAKIAWSILSTTHKAILDQNNRDKGIDRLLEIMNDVFTFVHEAKSLQMIQSHKQILAQMVQQTTECAYFIRDYSRDKSFWLRTAKNLVLDADERISLYEQKFNKLIAAFQGRAALETEIVVLRTASDVEDIAAQVDLNDMIYAKGAGYNPERECLPRTRETVIDGIIDWVNDPDIDGGARLFWLSGVAGSGKSAIANTVARIFDEQRRLGSSFRFDISNQGDRCPHHLFSTIAVDMADLDPQWKRCLWNVIKDRKALRTTSSVQLQFENFLSKPSRDLRIVGPIVIVIDALDECGEQASRAGLLSILSKRISELPANFRIIVTSRPESDIQEAFESNPHVFCKSMETIERESTDNDIWLFIQSQLSGVSFRDPWSDGRWSRVLTEKSEGLFQWASTACLFVKGRGKKSFDPSEQLDVLLSPGQGRRNRNILDQLYYKILEETFDTEDTGHMERFRKILGRVLATREPLSVSALYELDYEDHSIDLVRFILRPLGSLLSGVVQESIPVRPLHTSFRDFLTDVNRSGVFHIDTSQQNRNLTLACLHVMKSLRFNICQLETSHVPNNRVPGLASRVERAIPTHLAYSCRFYANHLGVTAFESDILEFIKEFLNTRLLYWLEALSLMNAINTASQALLEIRAWSRPHDDITGLAADASKFVAAFGSVISQSAPHIYLSALPFTPKMSRVSKVYLPKFPNTLSISAGKAINWPPIQSVLEGHADTVTSVGFSPDGKYIVSGCDDGTIKLWDAETGHALSRPFKGHSHSVWSVAFSPDGKRLVSGSNDKMISVWDAETGHAISSLVDEHSPRVSSVAFSPDGKRIVSGSSDNKIRVWNAETGHVVSGPFEGHSSPVTSVAFSRDGKHVVSGSYDRTIRVWEAETGHVLCQPLKGHSHSVSSVMFSPDGKHIVSGSHDTTIRVWDTRTGHVVAGPFQGHSSPVTSVAFSPNGKHIVSGSYDTTVRVWDAETGDIVFGPLEGHSDWVNSVGFSPDGKCIVSGSRDTTIRVWDAENFYVVSQTFEGHSDLVSSVACSPDGKCIVSGSYDRMVRLWDAENGHPLSPPFEGHSYFVSSVAFSPDGKSIVSGSYDTTLRVWDAETGQLLAGPFEGHFYSVSSVMYSPDGKRIASGSHDTTIRVWDAETGYNISGPFRGHLDWVTSVAYSPDGKCIASGSFDRTIRVWDAVTGHTHSGPFEGHSGGVTSVAYSPDGKRIVSGSYDKTIRVWDAETGHVLSGPFEGHPNYVNSVIFSPDGKHVVSGSEDKTIRVWNSETGRIFSGPFEGHSGPVRTVAISPDGMSLVSGSHDRTLRVWNTESSHVVLRPLEGQSNLLDGQGIISESSKYKSLVSHVDLKYKTISQSVGPLMDHHITQDTYLPEFKDDTLMERGWIVGSHSELLFWVPPWSREGLLWPRNTIVIAQPSIKLDFSRFVHGTAWEQCCE